MGSAAKALLFAALLALSPAGFAAAGQDRLDEHAANPTKAHLPAAEAPATGLNDRDEEPDPEDSATSQQLFSTLGALGLGLLGLMWVRRRGTEL